MLKRLLMVFLNFLLLAAPGAMAYAAGGEKVPDMATHKVKMAGLSAINAFFAGWYNDNKYVFALIVTFIMLAVGMMIALVTDVILKIIGMDVSKIEHHE